MKKYNKFVVLDLSKDNDFLLNNSIVFQISYGKVNTKNCNYINNNFFSEKKFEKYQKNLNKELFKLLKIIKNEKKINFELLEIFNQRNDKLNIYNKIYYFFELKKFIENKKFKEIEIYTDDEYFIDLYRTINFKNLKIIDLSKKNKKNTFLSYIFSTLFFFIKTFSFLLVIKFFRHDNDIKSNDKKAFLSLYPNFYKNNKEIFFDNNNVKINFQITDETHLNNSLSKNIKTFFEVKKIKKLIIVEKFMNLTDIFFYLFKSLQNIYILNKVKKFQFKINNTDVSKIFFNLFFQSLINLNKFYIYEKTLKKILNKYNFDEFHYYMFEYNFGYFLNKCFKENISNILLVGYQHGIYSERLMWQNFSNYIRSKKFFPNKIICKFKVSKPAYLNNFKKVKVLLSKKKINSKFKNENKNFTQNTVYLGLHDCYDILNFLRNLKKKNIFRIKIHPKMKFKKILKLNKNFNFDKKLNDIKKLSKTILSPTSTISYRLYEERENFKIAVPNNHIPLNPKILDSFVIKNNKL